MLKPLVPKFRSDLSVRLRDIAEKQVPAKLKPIVVPSQNADLLKVSSSPDAESVVPAGRTRRNPLLHSFRR